MEKLLVLLAFFIAAAFFSPNTVLAQSNAETVNHTAREEAEGKEILGKLQAKQLGCRNLTDDNYDSLGEYFMGQSLGNTQRHAAMNQMMASMMGEQGEKQMHITLGERYSGCTANASFPQGWIILLTPLLLLALGVTGLIALRKSRFLSRA